MLELTKAELLAKNHFINIIIKGKDIPINDGTDLFNFEFNKPAWFNEDKYNLGRQYYHENSMGILMTNLAGLILLLSVPSGLKILHGTGKSSTPPTARDRYIDTVLHTISWYDYPLDNSTKSWESLKTVRKLHNHASYTSLQKNLGFISQREVALTTFGFAGFVIIRPHLFGIQSNDDKKREGFMHFWAVLNYMLGVRDEFNIGLLPLDAVEIEFDLVMRNVLAPCIQVETELFKEMTNALVTGLKPYLPLLEYESQMFLTRRAVGIPGYQYGVDLKKEKPHRNIFTVEEMESFDEPLFNRNILLVKVKENQECSDINQNVISDCNNNRRTDSKYMEGVRNFFELPDSATLKIKEIPRDEATFMASLNDKKYNKLSVTAKMYLQMNLASVNALRNPIGKYLMDQFLSSALNRQKRQQRSRNGSKK